MVWMVWKPTIPQHFYSQGRMIASLSLTSTTALLLPLAASHAHFHRCFTQTLNNCTRRHPAHLHKRAHVRQRVRACLQPCRSPTINVPHAHTQRTHTVHTHTQCTPTHSAHPHTACTHTHTHTHSAHIHSAHTHTQRAHTHTHTISHTCARAVLLGSFQGLPISAASVSVGSVCDSIVNKSAAVVE